jgi:hypothetical protein
MAGEWLTCGSGGLLAGFAWGGTTRGDPEKQRREDRGVWARGLRLLEAFPVFPSVSLLLCFSGAVLKSATAVAAAPVARLFSRSSTADVIARGAEA